MVPPFPAICESVCGGTCPSVPYGVGATDRGPQKSRHATEYRPVFHGLDAVNGVGAAVLSHVGVNVGIVCHQIGFGAAVRHSAELERRSDSRRVFQLCRHTTRKK